MEPLTRPPEPIQTPGGISLKRYLLRLYLLTALPLLLLAGWLAYDNVTSTKAAQDLQAQSIASNFAQAMDQKLQARINALTAFAQSTRLDSPDQRSELYQEANALKTQLGMDFVVLDATPPYAMQINTLAPWGSTLPPIPKPKGFQAVPAALQTLRPAVGDAVTSAITQRTVVVVAVASVRNGRATHAVVSPVEVSTFQSFLDEFALPPGWALTLADGSGQPLAQRKPANFDPATDQGVAGEVVVPSTITQWAVKLQIPSDERLPPLLATGGALGLLLLITTGMGVFVGWSGSRRLHTAMASLTQINPATDELDIHEVREARTLLDETVKHDQASEARFQSLFQNSPIGMRLTDRQGKIMAQNAEFEALFGYTMADVPDLSVWMERAYPNPEDRQRVARIWGMPNDEQQLGRRALRSGEFHITAKDGQIKVVQVLGILLPDGMLSSFVDLTDKRMTESRLRLWADAFQYAELDLAIGDATTDTVLAVNPAFARSRGYSPEELLGMPTSRIQPPESHARIKEQLSQLQERPHFTLECEHFRKDGSRFPVLLDITVVHDAQGKPLARLVYAIDLTERNRAEAEIRALHDTLERRVTERTAQLTQANQELDSFAYTVSHDLRAPLRAMDGFLHLLREEHGAQLPADAQNHLDKIGSAIMRMKNLIEGILTLTHSARHDLAVSPVNLSELVQRRLGELAAAEPERSVRIEVQPGLIVEGDTRMLDVVVSNLVSNAWKYTGKTARPNVRFFAQERQGVTWFCLVDNGAGFDPKHAGKLFQPFQRMHRHEEFPGIGIGLATVLRVIQRHGGQIEAEAQPGEGAVFRFTLHPGAAATPHGPPHQSPE
ncbi:PAS domain S-box protein [Hydrogenophaga sp. PAMC20947]|uniref:sensor histidine kinase n=1 Tax=Hydrogenophaga sp. PAMC20947 TaxID=2565558 RepID=UPI0014450870|nr:PAS domain S-box protein [Hydrogenophaga sp. PAMC20947]